MKRFGHLYPRVYDLGNIREAHRRARRGKGHYAEVRQIERDPDQAFLEIQSRLRERTYRTSPYTCFQTRCSGKIREISKLPYYPDRIVHHAAMQVVAPIWFRTLIADTYACIPRRGIHQAARKIRRVVLDPDLLWLLDEIIGSAPGIPIGNYLRWRAKDGSFSQAATC